MKQSLLDRLLARQRKLMKELDEVPQPAVPNALAVRAPPLMSEAADLIDAEHALARADHKLVRRLLDPHRDRAGLPRTYLLLAQVEARAGRAEAAKKFLEHAERLDPDDQTVWSAFADLYRSMRRFDLEFPYRRRLAYSTKDTPIERYVALVRSLVAAAPKFKGPAGSEIEMLAKKILDSRDASQAFKVEAVEALFNTTASVDRAVEVLVEVDPPADGELDHFARWSFLTSWCTERGVALRRLDDEGVTGRRPTLADVGDAWLHPRLQWVPVLDNGRTIINGMASAEWPKRRDDATSPLMMRGSGGIVLRSPRQMQWVAQAALLVGGDGTIYGDLVEYTSVLAIAERLGLSKETPLVLSSQMARHQRDMLTLLGYGGEHPTVKVEPTGWVGFRRLVVTSRLTRGADWVDPLVPRWYRSRLASSMTSGARRLLLAPSLAVAERPELRAWAADMRFEIVQPDQWSAEEAIRTMSSAQVVVAPAHPMLTYAVFMSPGSSLWMVTHPRIIGNGTKLPFQALCLAADVLFEAIPAGDEIEAFDIDALTTAFKRSA